MNVTVFGQPVSLFSFLQEGAGWVDVGVQRHVLLAGGPFTASS